MNDKQLAEQLQLAAALEEPIRRALYSFVSGHPGEVTRDQAARGLRISRSIAAFHLDKLVEAGLLEATFRRLSGRTGPGAGRPSKLYRRSSRQIELSVPVRRYDLAGQLMARALSEGGTDGSIEALHRAACEWGEKLGSESRARAGASPSNSRLLRHAIDVLEDVGFEPQRDGHGGIVLKNCPFDALARGSRQLVCGMNHVLIQGLLAGLGTHGVHARMEPQPGTCCVAIRPDAASSTVLSERAPA